MNKRINSRALRTAAGQLQRRRLLGIGVGAFALGAFAACGGGGGGGNDDGDSGSPTPPDDDAGGAPGGGFGGGQGRIVRMTKIDEVELFDLATRKALRTESFGIESTLYGVTATRDGIIAVLTRPFAEYGIIVRTFGPDLNLLHQFSVDFGFGFNHGAAVISPDGRQVAVSVALGLPPEADWVIILADVDGGNQRVLETGRLVTDRTIERANPVWLADGRLLVQTELGLQISDAAVTTLGPALSSPAVAPAAAAIDPDGKHLRLEQYGSADGRAHVWSQDIETGALQPLISGGFQQSQAALSPDGRWLMYLDNRPVLRFGVPSELRENYVSVVPVADLPMDVTDLDVTLRDSEGELLDAINGPIGWF